jgi:hypothetical protein
MSQTLIRKAAPNKLVLGFLVAAITALVGTTGVANAESNGGNGHGNGHGYGGNIGIDIDINGNGNVIIIIINYMLGR